MREKKTPPKIISKYIDFLSTVMENSLPYDCPISLEEIVSNYAINKTVIKAIIDIKIIERKGKKEWTWLGDQITREMALKILDILLHDKKKILQLPISDEWATITASLQLIVDKLTLLSEIENNGVEGIEISRQKPDELFELIKVIAGGIYSQPSSADPFNNMQFGPISKHIILAAIDLHQQYVKHTNAPAIKLTE